MTKAELIDAIKAQLADKTATMHIKEKADIAAVLAALGEVAGKLNTVPTNHSFIAKALALDICMGFASNAKK